MVKNVPTGEQAALSLSFVDTTILTAHANAVHFTVGGLDAEDSAVVTFTDSSGGTTSKTVSANGTATVDLSGLADGAITASLQVATDAAGNTFTPVAAGNSATLDQDATEQATLSFADTLIGAAGTTAVHFSVGGLAADDSGTITFTDAANNTKTIDIVNGTPVSATVDLSGFTDGTVTASLSASDAAGNTFTANSSNTATLDQDSGEQAALSLTVGNTDIGVAAAAAVAFTIAGLDAEDTGSATFTDANNKTVTVNVSGGQTSYTANLTTLADGTITSSLAVNTDTAGNSFTPVAGTTVTLDQDKGQAQFILQGSSFGANTLTVDTSTGLAWLNVSLTAGHSYNDISSQLGAGQLYQGYRFATVAEVQTLWADFGVSLTPAASISQLEADLGVGDVWFDGTREVYGLTADSLSPGTHEAVYWAFNNPNFGAGVGYWQGKVRELRTRLVIFLMVPRTRRCWSRMSPPASRRRSRCLLLTPPSSRHTPKPFISPSAASMPRTARLPPLQIPQAAPRARQ